MENNSALTVVLHESQLNNLDISEVATESVLSKKLLLKIWLCSQENTCTGVFFLKVRNFIKKRLQHRCFLLNFVKF